MRGIFRDIERDARRRQRELEKQKKELERMGELARAKYEIEVYENHLDVLKSIHKDCGTVWDWEKIITSKAPDYEEPPYKHENEIEAQNLLKNYNPNFFERTFGKVEKKKANLLKNMEDAKEIDKAEYEKACEEYRERYREKYNKWKITTELAKRIIDGDARSYLEAIKEVNLFEEIKQLGSEIKIQITDKNLIISNLYMHSEKVVPSEVKSLLKSGKLFVKPIPITKFNEIYQDYVCGCVLRVARELFALLPIEMVIVNAIGNLLNTKTSYMEDAPILSACIPRKTLQNLNFNTIDPSDSMKNFVHRMNFKKGTGFSSVDVLNPSEFENKFTVRSAPNIPS